MQAGEDPTHRRGENHLGRNLPLGGSQDAGIGDEIAISLPDALKGIGKHLRLRNR